MIERIQQFPQKRRMQENVCKVTTVEHLDICACNAYNAYMEYVTLRVRKETQRKLKVVAALLEETMLETLDRLVAAELERVRKGLKDDQSSQNTPASHS
jgi:hypothetical protein